MADPHAVRDRPDRRLLPAGRADQGDAGRGSRGGAGRRGGGRRASSTSCGRRRRRDVSDRADPGRRAARRDAPEPEFEVARAPRRSSTRRRRRCASTLHVDRARAAARSTRSRSSRRSRSSPARRAYDDETRERLVELFGEPERWARRRRAASRWAQARRARARLHRLDEFALAGRRAPTTSRSAAAKYFHALPTARCRCASTSTARSSTAATTGGCRSSLVPWSCSAGFRHAGRRSGSETIDALLPRPRLGRGCTPRRSSALAARQGRARAADLRRGRATSCCEEADAMSDAARAARRLAALRGLRALPVHAGGDQERDADPVRDRLPARLRGRRDPTPSTTCGCECVLEAAAPDALLTRDGRASCSPAGERHQGGRAPASSCGRRRSPSSPRRSRRRFAFDGEPGRCASAAAAARASAAARCG